MNAIGRTAIVAGIAAIATLAPCRSSQADFLLLKVDGPKQCPEGLTVKCKAVNDDMLQYDVYVDAEDIAQAGELYRGRVQSSASLQVALDQETVATASVHGSAEGRRTWYQFTVSPSAAKASELQVGVSLYEKDGRPTLGGGASMQIRLGGFKPEQKQAGEAKAGR